MSLDSGAFGVLMGQLENFLDFLRLTFLALSCRASDGLGNNRSFAGQDFYFDRVT